MNVSEGKADQFAFSKKSTPSVKVPQNSHGDHLRGIQTDTLTLDGIILGATNGYKPLLRPCFAFCA